VREAAAGRDPKRNWHCEEEDEFCQIQFCYRRAHAVDADVRRSESSYFNTYFSWRIDWRFFWGQGRVFIRSRLPKAFSLSSSVWSL